MSAKSPLSLRLAINDGAEWLDHRQWSVRWTLQGIQDLPSCDVQIIGVSALTEPDGDLSHTRRVSCPARRDALANNYNPTSRLILADRIVTDSHVTFEGRRWFRGGASEAALGCDGRKRAPVFGVNFIEVQDPAAEDED